jgi:hypothetical protein
VSLPVGKPGAGDRKLNERGGTFLLARETSGVVVTDIVQVTEHLARPFDDGATRGSVCHLLGSFHTAAEIWVSVGGEEVPRARTQRAELSAHSGSYARRHTES